MAVSFLRRYYYVRNHMKCPKCNMELLGSVRENIEIDCCPSCGGIWLDHGELWELMAAYAPEMMKYRENKKIESLKKSLTSTGSLSGSEG